MKENIIGVATRLYQKRFFHFCLVGTAGFITDAGILKIGIMAFHLSPLWARVPSFSVAVLVTWWVNRNFTFAARERSFRESFPPYLLANALGLGINLGIYGGSVLLSPFMASHPLLPLAIAAGVALFFNFTLSRRLIFREKKS